MNFTSQISIFLTSNRESEANPEILFCYSFEMKQKRNKYLEQILSRDHRKKKLLTKNDDKEENENEI